MENINIDKTQNTYEKEEVEQTVYLSKINGVWKMEVYKDGQLKVGQGKELVIALMDTENPIANTFVDGEILDTQYNCLHVKFGSEKEVKDHKCFNSSQEDIMNILNNDGLVLALGTKNMPMTDKFQQYIIENKIDMSK